MAKALRAQVSLVFTDEEVFNNLIIPFKDNKELSNLIIKLLTVYYRDEGIRTEIEGISLNELLGNADQILDSDEAFESINQIRKTLAVQGYLFEEATRVLDDGISNIDLIMKANDIAKQSGVVKTETTDVGEVVTNLNLEDSTFKEDIEEPTKPSHIDELDAKVNRLEESVSEILSILKNGGGFVTSSSILDTTSDDVNGDNTKTESLSSETEVLLTNEVIEPEISSEISNDENLSLDEANNSEDYSNQNVGQEDASSALNDVLNDLLGL